MPSLERFISEGSEINLRKLDSRGGTSVVVEHVSDEAMGGAFAKSKIEVTAHKGKICKNLQLVMKLVSVGSGRGPVFGEEKVTMSEAERYFARWQFLRRIGVPTVPSMRVVNDDLVAMGDMTRYGGEFFGKAKRRDIRYEEQDKIRRKLTKMERLFLRVDNEKVKDELKTIQERLVKHGVSFPIDDAYDLLVNPDGTWSVFVMDLGMLRMREPEKKWELEAEIAILGQSNDMLKSDLLKISI